MNAQVDHLVVIADNLTQGENWLRQTFGATPVVGGQHLSMGTHNLLLRVGLDVYLEVIAIDSTQPAPQRPRWFEMDRPDVQAAAKQMPQLVHFVARTPDLADTIKRARHEPGETLALSRGAFCWNITVAPNGSLSDYGLVPTLIEWRGAKPSDALPDSGVKLQSLLALHPEPQRLGELHRAIGLEGVTVKQSERPELVAAFEGARGDVRLSSPMLERK